jgi:hypothetical protein
MYVVFVAIVLVADVYHRAVVVPRLERTKVEAELHRQQMAAQQAALRAKLEQLRREMNKDGKGSGNALNPLINALDQQEKDLINRNKKADFVKRQKDIITRLLESEDALRERGFDEKRESKSAKDYNNGNLRAINQYNQQKAKQLDVLHLLNPSYRKYYKDKVNQYFNEFQY